MVADKCKKLKASDKVEDDQNEEPQIDAALVLSIEKLQEIQDELEKIDEELSEKVLEIEQKYNEVRKPVYDKRNDIIKSIPDFWLIAFLSHPILAQLVSEEDHKVFKYLSYIEVEDFKDVKSGYFISFNFNPNPFFEDSKLTKSVTFLDDGTPEIMGTTIKWKEGMDLSNGVANDNKGSKRPHAGDESFFSWFSKTQQEDEVDEIQPEAIADIIKEDLWPNPLTYFTNEADELDFEGGKCDEEENGNEGSEDEEDEDGGEDEGN